jgi:hypothetical protein
MGGANLTDVQDSTVAGSMPSSLCVGLSSLSRMSMISVVHWAVNMGE